MKKFIYILILIFSFSSLPKANSSILPSNKGDKILIGALVFAAGSAGYIIAKEYFKERKNDIGLTFAKFLSNHLEIERPLTDELRYLMSNTKNEKHYIIYQKLADIAGMSDVPPFMPENSSKYNPEGIEGHNGNIDNKLENPISYINFPYILENPKTGERIDTRLEFPMETPKDWDEYILLRDDNSNILGKNMENAGMIRPNHTARHHIIPVTMKDAKPAVDRMKDFGIGANAAENGIYLPQAGVDSSGNPSSAVGLIHSGVHPRIYAQAVNKRIMDLNINTNDIPGGKQKIINELNTMRQELIDAPKNGKTWYDVFKNKENE
jgi:hypothetical protein